MNKDESKKIIKLLSIVIVLLFIIIMALVFMPGMNNAREKAFRIEATKIVDASKSVMKSFNDGIITFNENTSNSCRMGNKYCFTISELKRLDKYKSDSDDYVGKIEVDLNNPDKPLYVLYLKKSYELKIIAGTREDYINMGVIAIEPWQEEFEKCNCE